LHFAVSKGYQELVIKLLEFGANVNIADECGFALSYEFTLLFFDEPSFRSTPLHFAVQKNHVEIAGILLSKGAITTAVDEDNNPPMFYCKSKKMAKVFVEWKRKDGKQ
jgi:ankyrin repeat protein